MQNLRSDPISYLDLNALILSMTSTGTRAQSIITNQAEAEGACVLNAFCMKGAYNTTI